MSLMTVQSENLIKLADAIRKNSDIENELAFPDGFIENLGGEDKLVQLIGGTKSYLLEGKQYSKNQSKCYYFDFPYSEKDNIKLALIFCKSFTQNSSRASISEGQVYFAYQWSNNDIAAAGVALNTTNASYSQINHKINFSNYNENLSLPANVTFFSGDSLSLAAGYVSQGYTAYIVV